LVSVEFKHKDLSEKIIKAFYNVYNTLGYGFLEKVYRNAMLIELQHLGLKVVPESKIVVYYQSQIFPEKRTTTLARAPYTGYLPIPILNIL